MAKSALRLQARALRKQGKSLGEISQELHIAKSSASKWCKDIKLSQEQKITILAKEFYGKTKGRFLAAQKKCAERQTRIDNFQLDAIHDVGKLSDRDLFILGIGLYWAEGAKRQREVRFVNSDPHLPQSFQLFMLNVCQKSRSEVKYRLQVNITHKDRYQEILQYWMNVFHVGQQSFSKPSFVKSRHKRVYKNRTTYYGTVRLEYKKSTNNSYLILGYINAVKYWIQHHMPG